VDDEMKHTFIRADVLEFRPGREGGDFRWDVEGWRGGDFNRFWFKSEGERNTALKADYDIDLQMLYGRFVKKYYDFQVGLRIETQSFRGANVTRPQFVIGLEGLVPYRYEVESALFISHQGHVSGRVSFTRDYLLTQRWILQGRVEANAAAQRVERFTTGKGLNNIEAGLRLRYEVQRKFGPYIGISYDRSFFGTANFVRQDGGDPRQLRFVAGVRVWH
jgi:copper resistance protein B